MFKINIALINIFSDGSRNPDNIPSCLGLIESSLEQCPLQVKLVNKHSLVNKNLLKMIPQDLDSFISKIYIKRKNLDQSKLWLPAWIDDWSTFKYEFTIYTRQTA